MIAWSEILAPASGGHADDGNPPLLPTRTQEHKQYPNLVDIEQEQWI
jgi:hypothetical protein